ncbi:MAG: RNA polymerase sigma factor [Planctomycetota bacterium]|jgi:DNA-directed RNA polymerase specialized sigma24 family protein
MFGKAVNYELTWDFTFSGAVDESQQWILSAMQRHGQGLITILWRILGNEQDVCDAYQNTFLQLAHYKGRQKPEHIKASEKKRLSTIVTREGAISPEYELDCKYLQETLRCYIAQLPEHLRNVVMLRDLGELSYAQVSRILDISAATARVYRCKAIQLLAVWMGKEREERK